ncbi:hypothetical protein Pmani_036380, partial [Petrolisthes manimaculis]
ALDATLNNPAGLLPSIDTAFGISQGLLTPSSSSSQQQHQQQGGGGQAKGHLKDTGSSSSSSSSSSSPPPPPPPHPPLPSSSSSSGPPAPSTPSLSITTSPTFHSLSLSTSPSASCRSSPVLPSTCSSLCDSQPLDSLALSDHHLDSHSMDLDLDLRKLHQFTSPSGVAKGTVVGGGVGGSGVWRNLKREREEMLGPIVCHKKTRLFSPTQDHQHLPLPYNSSAFWPTAHNPLDAFTNPPFTHTAYSRHLASAGISSAGLSSTGPTLTSASLHAPNRIRSPPGLIPLPTHQQPIRPRPIPLPRHPTALTPGMTDWDSCESVGHCGDITLSKTSHNTYILVHTYIHTYITLIQIFNPVGEVTKMKLDIHTHPYRTQQTTDSCLPAHERKDGGVTAAAVGVGGTTYGAIGEKKREGDEKKERIQGDEDEKKGRREGDEKGRREGEEKDVRREGDEDEKKGRREGDEKGRREGDEDEKKGRREGEEKDVSKEGKEKDEIKEGEEMKVKGDGKDNNQNNINTKTLYKRRFWILVLFAAICFVHNTHWVTWGPISETMEAAFPGWGSSTVALLTNWPGIMYELTVIPTCWLIQRYGLRAATLTSITLMTFGTALRCITSVTPAFTVLCHLCAIMVGLSAPAILSAIPLLAAAWFPTRERTTALAVLLGCHQLGAMGSYLEPLLVSPPSPSITTQQLQHDVMMLMYLDVGVTGVLLVAALVYFPSKPPTPPSFTSVSPRVDIIPALRQMVRNKRLVMLMCTYAVFAGPPLAWITVLNYSLLPLGFHQNDTMWVGVVTVIASSVVPVVSGRINDLFKGHIKLLIVVFMVGTTICNFWFLLLTYEVIPLSTWQVYMSVVGIVACSYSTIPLFSEASFDLAYPAPEFLMSGMLISTDIAVMFLFLLIFNIPNVGYRWITCILTLTSSIPLLPLLKLKLDTTRADLDSGTSHTSTTTLNP